MDSHLPDSLLDSVTSAREVLPSTRHLGERHRSGTPQQAAAAAAAVPLPAHIKPMNRPNSRSIDHHHTLRDTLQMCTEHHCHLPSFFRGFKFSRVGLLIFSAHLHTCSFVPDSASGSDSTRSDSYRLSTSLSYVFFALMHPQVI